MFLYPFDDRSAGLSNVVVVAVLAGNLVDGVHSVGLRSGSFVGIQEGHQHGGRGECCGDVISLECGLYTFVITSGERYENISRGGSLLLR